MSINSTEQPNHYIGNGGSPLPRHDFINVNSPVPSTMRSVNAGPTPVTSMDWNPRDGAMSAARRTFCLFSTFDLILSFILWVIYSQLIGYTPIWKAFEDQVFQYRFQNSMFDTVMIAAARFTFIMLAYALFRISHWWVISISTTMTCIYLICKCFLFEFNDKLLGGDNPLSYIILIVCFVVAWIETWMLDFKVVPTEKKMMEGDINSGRYSRLSYDPERQPLLRNSNSSPTLEDTREYYSPFHTPQGSDDEAEVNGHTAAHSNRVGSGGRKASDASLYSAQSGVESENYTKLLEEAREGMLEILQMDASHWKHEAGQSPEEGGIVHSCYMKKYKKKVMRIQGIVNLPPRVLWEDMVATLNDSPKWNPTILESRTLQVLDDHSEITYNIASEAGGGLVSARDFISIRQWMPLGDGSYVSCGTNCTHPDMPVQKKYVRGENSPGGYYFEPVEGQPGSCKFTWIVNSNIKGWIPQAAVDQAMSNVMLQYFKLLCEHYQDFTYDLEAEQNCV